MAFLVDRQQPLEPHTSHDDISLITYLAVRSELETCVRAHRHLAWSAEYVKRHGIESYKEEAQLAGELSELLVEKIKLLQRMQQVGEGAGRK